MVKLTNANIDRFYAVLLFAVSIVIFLPSLGFGLYQQWDDAHFLLNGHMEADFDNVAYWLTHPTMTLYTPVTMFSFMLDYSLWGINPALSRGVNILLHGLSVFLLFKLMKLIGARRSVAFLFSLAFAINPQRVGSVVWIAERKDVLCAVAYLGALICFIRACRRDRISMGALVLLIVGLGAKPMGFSLPLVFAMYAFHHYRTFRIKPYFMILWPFILISLAGFAIFKYFSPEKLSLLEFPHCLFVAVHNVGWYISTAVLPLGVCPVYPQVRFSTGTVMMLVVTFSLCGCLLYFLWKRYDSRTMLYDVMPVAVAYLFSLIPILGIVMVSYTNYCDRYNYIPAALLFSGLSLVVSKCKISAHRLIWFAVPVYFAYMTAMTITYIPDWRSGYSIFKAAQRYDRYPNLKVMLGIAENGIRARRPDYTVEGGKLLLKYSHFQPNKPLPQSPRQGESMYNTALGMIGIGYVQLGFPSRGAVYLKEFQRIHQQGSIKLYLGGLIMRDVYKSLAQYYFANGETLKAKQALLNAK